MLGFLMSSFWQIAPAPLEGEGKKNMYQMSYSPKWETEGDQILLAGSDFLWHVW